MTLYSIMPYELVYPPNEEDYQKQKIIEMNGVSVLVNEQSPGEHYVVRVMSSNPQDYLCEQFTPGCKISLPIQ